MAKIILDNSLRAYLEKPRIARMSTIDANGYPHTVPVWFMLDGSDLVVIGTRDARKVSHILANPKGSIQIGGEPDDESGYLFKGQFTIEEDPDRRWVKTMTMRYENGAQADKDIAAWSALDMILMRLKPTAILKVY